MMSTLPHWPNTVLATPPGRLASPYVYVGAGRGLGLYIGDQLIHGAHGLAGEIGFLPASTALTSPATKRHKRRLV